MKETEIDFILFCYIQKMDLDKSTTLQEEGEVDSISNANLLKTFDTQNIIRNKFKKACTNRLERENDANQAMRPLTEISTLAPLSNDLEYKDNEFSSHNSSKSQIIKAIHQPRLAANKSRSAREKEKEHDPNELCNRLRLLVTAQIAGNVNKMQEINSIIAELRDLGIIV